MTALIRAEARKLRFTRSLVAVPAVGIAVAIVGSVLLVTVGKQAEMPDRLSALGPLRFGPTNFGLLLLVFGTRVLADESQHRTLSATLVRSPRRVDVVAAKALVTAVVVVGFCIAVDAVTIGITAVGARMRELDLTYDVVATTAMLARVVVATVLLAVIGVALGGAVRNRTVAIVGAVAWFALGEDLLGALLHVSRYLPGAAVQGLVSNTSTADHLAAAGSTALLCLYLAAASVAAAAALRRDIA